MTNISFDNVQNYIQDGLIIAGNGIKAGYGLLGRAISEGLHYCSTNKYAAGSVIVIANLFLLNC